MCKNASLTVAIREKSNMLFLEKFHIEFACFFYELITIIVERIAILYETSDSFTVTESFVIHSNNIETILNKNF